MTTSYDQLAIEKKWQFLYLQFIESSQPSQFALHWLLGHSPSIILTYNAVFFLPWSALE